MMIWIGLGIFVVAGLGIVLFLKIIQYAQQQILQSVRQEFKVHQSEAVTQLEVRKQAVEDTVRGLKEQMEKYQQLLRQLEEDRSRKYGNLEAELKNASTATQRLQEVTGRLSNILGNVKLRGQWGERMAEDIIHYAGLIENVNYHKQTANAAMTKPDYTFFLPNGHKINMDVKFPLDNYLQMVNTEAAEQKEFYQKEFIRNVKDRIKEVQNREYINPAERTLDFVLLFIPNEQVFGLIQEKMPELMDVALKQKVVLCSPFTLYAMLSVVRQAHENFCYEKDLKQIIQLIDQFAKIYGTFKMRFEAMGEALSKVNQQYQEIQDKSFKQLDTKIRHIDDHKKGHLPDLPPAPQSNVIDVA
ncbi:MAG TPA: DNA recombination protein RmuC [Candidatus Omnitrophota bacterium]|nr:DNA recombination protein RmuC [Candidatus Omnitrophota bacterium]